MRKSIMLLLMSLISSVSYGGDPKVSALAVKAEEIGPDWTGPTGIVIDDIDVPPTIDKETTEIIAGLTKQMKPLGAKACADFTYRKKSNPMQQVTVRVFLFNTEEQCKEWMKTKYEFSGWEKKYRRVQEMDYSGFDSLEMKKRILSAGKLWITSGTIGADDDHLTILGLFLDRIKKQTTGAEPPAGGDGKPAPQP